MFVQIPPIIIHSRDLTFVKSDLEEYLEATGCIKTCSIEEQDIAYIHFNEVIKNAWYIDFFKVLTENNIQVFGKEKVNKINVNAYKPITLLRTSSAIDWFQIKLKVTFNGQAVSLRDIRKAIIKKEQYILFSFVCSIFT